jgi:steroid delta-isomerase-like uncharacterized protein
VIEWTDALNRHDPDAAAAYIAEDCVFTNVGTGKRHIGRAAVRDEGFRGLLSRSSDVHIETTNLLIAGDHYTKEWVMTGVHSGDMPGLPTTGKTFRLLGAGVGHVRDGKIVNFTEYWNLADFLRQVGALPTPS